ncbi:MAG TPA: lysophospholipid acyltransferase family protein [Actinomycetota bacterium]|jgi:1-acyl-sn-glycerol-3-phosphate acyltransferase|nr:lysophospholipid acyltransferase family protein [Actinomycetota bacterium]
MRGPGDLNVWWRLGIAVLGPVARALFRIRVVGAGHVPWDSAAIVASNHVSALDGPILAVVIARERYRMTRFVTGAEFFERPAYGWILRLFRQIPIHRGTGDDRALDEAVGTVRSGAVAGIFPEGRVNAAPDDGMQRGRTGVGRIARAAEVPIVPVAIWGTQHRWPRQGLCWNRPWRTTVAVAFGPPLRVDASDDAAELAAKVMDSIEDSLDRARHLRGDG